MRRLPTAAQRRLCVPQPEEAHTATKTLRSPKERKKENFTELRLRQSSTLVKQIALKKNEMRIHTQS